MSKSCVIIGGGIAGSASALALSIIGVPCSIHELRDTPSRIGGAINLTPNALRVLKDLGVTVSGCTVTPIEFWSLHTAGKQGEMPSQGTDGHTLRMLRKDLQDSFLAAVKQSGIKIIYSSKLASIQDDVTIDKVNAELGKWGFGQADFSIGCDGIHSAVRSMYVEPDRYLSTLVPREHIIL